MTDFPAGLSEAAQVVSASGLPDQAAAALTQLAGKGYEVRTGLTASYAKQILAMAKEPAIREYCPKDADERFIGQAAAERWMTKRRAVFLLLKRSEQGLQLAGYGWAGPAANSHVPGGRTTFALRIGQVGHGQGLAAPFSWLIIAAAAAQHGARDFWLETWASNGAAVHIYHKLGFETVAEAPGERSSPASGMVADTRIYMSLPNRQL